jgi:hypothetical protein
MGVGRAAPMEGVWGQFSCQRKPFLMVLSKSSGRAVPVASKCRANSQPKTATII